MPGEVFISYARKDTAFVRRLHQALAALNRDAWIDWEDIPLTADWWREIQTGIEAADTFVFVISPDSAQSQICYREIDYAAQHNKRLMPIMHREIADPVVEQKLHPAINAHNWAFFRDTDNFDTSFQALIDAMDTDLAYVREHTRLLVRARNWEAHHHDPSQLLRDNDLRVAEDWLAKGLQKQRNRPADLHVTYIHRSRRAQNRRMQRTVVLAILIALIIGLMIASLLLREDARMAQEKAVKERQISEAIGLAAQAQLELFGSVPERGVLLALEALDADRPYVWEADRALGAAVQISHARSIFAGHEGQINDVAWSPDGTRVATASQTASDPPSGSVIIWDAASGQPIVFTDPANNEPRFVLSGHTSVVTSVAWSPDSRYIITGSRDATAKIWDTSTGTEIDTIYGHGAEWINDVAWSPDGAYVATASNDETSKIWRVADRLTPAADTPNQAYMVQTYNPEEERGLIAVLA
ncbi:MAG: TIR domain-containing protein, partial [Anaerolineae bacterium]|nr:TIR domain-containing protein [Anaerolineae bacterium]